jgi:DNA repair protein RadC
MMQELHTRWSVFDDLADLTTERFDVAYLSDRQNVINISRFGDGRTDQVRAPLRLIIANALSLGAAGVVIAHNHPSGIAVPSKKDCSFTRSLAQMVKSLEMPLLDHLIYTRNDRFSFREAGLL